MTPEDELFIADENLRHSAFEALGFNREESFYLICGWNMVWAD